MFKETIQVEILDRNEKQKYIDRAEELGYTLAHDLSNIIEERMYIVLYSGELRYNIIGGFNYKTISQEEFFGSKEMQTGKIMRKQIDKEVLELLIKNTVESLDSFSIYDVTCLIRQKLPSHKISHDEVKDIVLNVCQNYEQKTNGVYRVFSKPNAINAVKAAGFNVQQSSGRTSVSLTPVATKTTSSVSATTGKVYTVYIGSEGRITLTKKLLDKLFNNPQTINVSKENGRVLISNRPISKNDKVIFTLPTRIRTTLKGGTARIKEISGSTKFPLYEVSN